jgi:sigma-B regulation protein RsbU (phosphoserine phosphatase)
MAHSGFSSKPESSIERARRFERRRMLGSLGRRVLLICAVFVIIPLFINSLIVFRSDYRSKLGALLSSLSIIAEGQKFFLDELILSKLNDLMLIEEIIRLKRSQDERGLNQIFDQIAKGEPISSLFYQEQDLAGGFTCIASLQKQMQKEKNIFPEALRQTIAQGEYVFLDQDPITQEKMLFISRAVREGSAKDTPISGVLFMGISADKLVHQLAYLEKLHFHFTVSLIDRKGEIFVSTNPNVSLDTVQVLTGNALEKNQEHLVNSSGDGTFNVEMFNIGMFHILKKKEQEIGFKEPIEHSALFILTNVSEKIVFDVAKQEMLSRLGLVLLLIVLVGGGATLWSASRMARPLEELSDVMEKVQTGDLSARYKEDRMGFEINVLGSHFNQMIDALIQHMEVAKNERVARELMASELKIGQEIQKSILPKRLPEFPGLDIAAGFLAAQEVAGDFYDLLVKNTQGGQQLFIAMADASGKGISACLYSLLVRSMLRSYAESTADLEKIIHWTNNLFCKDTGDTGVFVTAWTGIFDEKTRVLHYSSAGHLPALLLRKDGTIEELTTKGTALGVILFDQVAVATTTLQKGDLLLLYTDGVLEAHNDKNQLFGSSRLLEIVRQQHGPASQALVDRILEEVETFAAGAPQHDDLTLLAIRLL